MKKLLMICLLLSPSIASAFADGPFTTGGVDYIASNCASIVDPKAFTASEPPDCPTNFELYYDKVFVGDIDGTYTAGDNLCTWYAGTGTECDYVVAPPPVTATTFEDFLSNDFRPYVLDGCGLGCLVWLSLYCANRGWLAFKGIAS